MVEGPQPVVSIFINTKSLWQTSIVLTGALALGSDIICKYLPFAILYYVTSMHLFRFLSVKALLVNHINPTS